MLNDDGKINKINKSGKNFFEEDLRNRYIWEMNCFNEEDKNWLKNVIINYNENEKIEKELSIINLGIKKRNLELTINSFMIDDKKEIVIFAKDITEKKLQERELKQAYTVFQNTHDGILITDDNVNIINVNKAFIKTTGYSLEESIGKNPSILKSDKNSKDFYAKMWNELKNNGYWDGEIVNRKKDGTNYTEWLTVSAVYNGKEELLNYIGIFSDITKQKHQEELIKEKERMLFNQSKMASMGEMLGNIAHQWRQPLSVISVAAGAIKLNNKYKDIYKEEEVESFIDSISNSTNYLSETIDDFRNFFMEDTKSNNFDCLSVVNSTLKLLITNFKFKHIEIVFDRQESGIIFGSENEFRQVLMNILNNAKDALLSKNIEDDKYIFIDIYLDEEHIYIDVLDTAGGIQKDILEKVFEPYFTTKHKSIGTGIGLYMSEEIIVKHMEGEIFVSNKERVYNGTNYKGACFTVKVPLSKDEDLNE